MARTNRLAFTPDHTPDLDAAPATRSTGVVAFRPLARPEPHRPKVRTARKLKNLWRRKDAQGKEYGCYIIRARVNKQWLNESTGFETIAEAERKRDERIKAVKEMGNGWVSLKGTVREWWTTFKRDYLDGGEKGPTTCASYVQNVGPFVEQYADRHLSTIVPDECQTWLAGLKARGLKDSTRGLHRIQLKAFFGQAIKSHKLRGNPWDGTTALVGEAREVILAEADVPAYLGALDADDRRCAITILESGLRHAEIDQLRPRDVTPTQINVRKETAKYRRARTVPIQPETFAVIEAQRLARGLDPHATARLWDRSKAGHSATLKTRCRGRLKRFAKALAPVGLTELTIHDLRRTYGTRCALAGMPPKTLMLVMGHKSLEVTMHHYTIVNGMQAADAVARVVFLRPPV